MIVVIVGDWRLHLIRGIAALLFGAAALIWPDITVWALVALFGAFVLVHGVVTIAAVVTDAPATRGRRWWLVVQGVLSVAAGIVTFVWPDITGLALLYVIAAWAAATGFMELAGAVLLRREMRHEWVLGLSGLLSIAFAVLLVITPGTGALVITWLIGWYAVVYGVLLLALAWRLRKLQPALDRSIARPEGAPS
jgi:uncharacterized membrane protein HdeD (DUF308 family)